MAAIAPKRMSEHSERLFFTGMTFLTTAIILWGFAPSFFLRGIAPPVVHSYLDPPPQPVRWLYITHGVVFTAWVTLCAAQVLLVATGRSALHRRAGQGA